MATSTVFGAAVGILLGRHFRAWVLLPAILLVVSGAILHGLVDDQNVLTITLHSLCAIAALEVCYLLVAIAGEYLPAIKVSHRNAKLLRVVRTAIGQELNRHFQLPGDVPPKMAAIITRLR